MGAVGKKNIKLQHLYGTSTPSSQQDHHSIESLKQRLNALIAQDPQKARQAALIIENWLKSGPKK
jgi:hypothetical protein